MRRGAEGANLSAESRRLNAVDVVLGETVDGEVRLGDEVPGDKALARARGTELRNSLRKAQEAQTKLPVVDRLKLDFLPSRPTVHASLPCPSLLAPVLFVLENEITVLKLRKVSASTLSPSAVSVELTFQEYTASRGRALDARNLTTSPFFAALFFAGEKIVWCCK